MRRVLGLGLAATLLVGTACGGGSDGPTGPQQQAGPGTMTAQVNGTAWTATTLKRAFRSGDLITIQGQDAANRIITIVVRTTTTGTFTLAFPNGLGHNASYASAPALWSSALIGGAGSISITTFSATQLVGTFDFTGISAVANTAPAQITNGAFNLPIS